LPSYSSLHLNVHFRPQTTLTWPWNGNDVNLLMLLFMRREINQKV